MRAFKRDGGLIKRNGAGKLGCCCPECHDGTSAPTLDIVLSGILVTCGCTIEGGIFSYNITGTNINGAHTLTWDGGTSSWKLAAAGTVTVDHFLDDTCTTLDRTEVLDVDIEVTCAIVSGAAQYQVNVITQDSSVVMFDGAGELGAPIANEEACPDVTGGTATLSL
jgi:hypothetical protein